MSPRVRSLFVLILLGLVNLGCSSNTSFAGDVDDCAVDAVPEYGSKLKSICEDGLQVGPAPESVRLIYNSRGESGAGTVLIFQKAGGISGVETEVPLVAKATRGEVAVLQVDVAVLPFGALPNETEFTLESPVGDTKCTLRFNTYRFEC